MQCDLTKEVRSRDHAYRLNPTRIMQNSCGRGIYLPIDWFLSGYRIYMGVQGIVSGSKENIKAESEMIPELETAPWTPHVKAVNNPFQNPFVFARFRYDGREDDTAVDEDEEGSRHPQQTQAEHGRTT